MLAAYDDASLRTTTYNGVESYWLENLYSSFKDLPITNDHEYYDTLKKLLREAENVGVLSNGENLIVARIVKQDLKNDIEEIKGAFRFTFQYLHQLDKKHSIIEHDLDTLKSGMRRLDEQYKAYKAQRVFPGLISVAVALIPLVGSSIANAIGAALEMSNVFIEGIESINQSDDGSSKSKSSPNSGTKMNDCEPAGMPQTLFKQAISALDCMNEDSLKEVDKILHQYGENINTLREEFEQQLRNLSNSSPDSNKDSIALTESDKEISRWKDISTDVNQICSFNSSKLARVLAAGLVSFDDEDDKEFQDLYGKLQSVLRKNCISGMLLQSPEFAEKVKKIIVDVLESSKSLVIGRSYFIDGFFDQFMRKM